MDQADAVHIYNCGIIMKGLGYVHCTETHDKSAAKSAPMCGFCHGTIIDFRQRLIHCKICTIGVNFKCERTLKGR